jgi:bacterioferritin (cytochrome b1)
MGKATDTNTLTKDLGTVLPLLARDAVAAATAAGSIAGPEGIALSPHLRRMATDEVADIERVAARIASLGGTPSVSVAVVKPPKAWRQAVIRLIEMQREALDAVVNAIPADADDAEGEATEHLLEHIASRKRDALELLERTLR